MTDESYLKKLADMQTQIKELVPDSLKENEERRIKEWICREMSTSTSCNENGILMIEKELIRCKDCKFLRFTGTVWKCQNRSVMMLCEMDDFCSRAERK